MKIATEVEYAWDADTEQYVATRSTYEDYEGAVSECGGGGGGKGILGTAIAIGGMFIAPGIGGMLNSATGLGLGEVATAALGSSVVGAAAGYAATGTLKGAIGGGVTGGVMGYAGAALGGPAGVVGSDVTPTAGVTGGAPAAGGVGGVSLYPSTPALAASPNPTNFMDTSTPMNLFGGGAGGTGAAADMSGGTAWDKMFSGVPATAGGSPVVANTGATAGGTWDNFVSGATKGFSAENMGSAAMRMGVNAVGQMLAPELPGAGDMRGLLEQQQKIDAANREKRAQLLHQGEQMAALNAPDFTATQAFNQQRQQGARAEESARERLIAAGYTPGSAAYEQAMSGERQRQGAARAYAYNSAKAAALPAQVGTYTGLAGMYPLSSPSGLVSSYDALNKRQQDYEATMGKQIGQLMNPYDAAAEDRRRAEIRNAGMRPTSDNEAAYY